MCGHGLVDAGILSSCSRAKAIFGSLSLLTLRTCSPVPVISNTTTVQQHCSGEVKNQAACENTSC